MKSLCKLVALLFLTNGSLSALVVIEDFGYSSIATGGTLAGNAAGGIGWSGAWQGNANVFYHSTTNLVYANYPLPTDTASGSLYSSISGYRAIYRYFAEEMSGEVWFSYVFRKGGTGQGGLLFNATAAHATGAAPEWSILVDANSGLNVKVNGQVSGLVDVANAVEYLVLGRIVTGSAGTFQIWVNPNLNAVAGFEDFLAMVMPVYSYSAGEQLEPLVSVGLAAFRGAGGSSVMRIDALRFSDGEGSPQMAFQDVTGVVDADENIDDPPVIGQVSLADGFTAISSARRWLNTPIQRLADGRLAIPADSNGVVFATEEMLSWSNPVRILTAEMRAQHTGSLPTGGALFLETSGGNWVMVWRDPRFPAALADYWDRDTGEPVPHASAKIWSSHSFDQGQTWSAPQILLDLPGGYAPKQMIETRQGMLILPMQYHEREPGRNVITVARSTDHGVSWTVAPQIIDLGGVGAHDGVLEPTLVELRDGRIWILFRTSTGWLGQSFSHDEGMTWSAATLTAISASSSPPYIDRLRDGRLLLLWNREKPADGGSYPTRGNDTFYSLEFASWWRQELVLAISPDDGLSWSDPVVVARHERSSGRVSYPYFFETLDRRVLVFANQGKVEASTTSTVRTSFAEYRRQHFTAQQWMEDSISGPQGDANGDGVPNLVHYAFGISPWDFADKPAVSFDKQRLRMQFLRRIQPSDLSYIAEVSNDLVDWRSGEAEFLEEVTPIDTVFERVSVSVDGMAEPWIFLRLILALPPQ